MVIIISLVLLALGIYGVVFLKQEYDPNSFIPTDSYLKDYVDAYEKHFPEQGTDSGYLYLGKKITTSSILHYYVSLLV